jgi:hypothetical protein
VRYYRTAIIVLFIASLSHAQGAAPSEREMIQQLVQPVTVLQEKVRRLESQQGANGLSTPDATPQPRERTHRPHVYRAVARPWPRRLATIR